jgi:hypothetical protein
MALMALQLDIKVIDSYEFRYQKTEVDRLGSIDIEQRIVFFINRG